MMKRAVLFFCVLLFTSAVSARRTSEQELAKRNKRMDAGAAALILIGLMISGTTLAGTTVQGLMAPNFAVSVGFEVENYSKWIMKRPKVYIETGYVNKPPRPVFPLRREAMASHKTANSVKGSFGSVSWLIDNPRLIMMWSAPYNHDFYINKLAIGMKTTHTKADTNEMYGGKETWFTRVGYYYDSQSLVYTTDKLIIIAQMGTSHKPVVRMQVYAKKYEDLPNKAKEKIKKEDYQVL